MKDSLPFLLLSASIVNSSPAALPTPRGETNLSAIIGPTCIDATLWSLPTFSAGDCHSAFQSLLRDDVASYGREVFDFMVAGSTSRTRYRKVQLPAAYEYGTCTLAVAMLATIPLQYLPPIPLGTFFPETDRSTYEIISILAERVKMMCVDGTGNTEKRGGRDGDGGDFLVTLPGWITAGSRNAIGIFFFDSRSFMRRLVFGGLGGGTDWQRNSSVTGHGEVSQRIHSVNDYAAKGENMI